ncbi:hypothetical protein EVAR_11978_1 [Eumeta japonica]|uniref:Uncharacterized protein n=1 Tax=Eumeta variegata TaxID=151549 RepID=A0A4C1U501_EUMVA|nr:hypothetical protein EVAR_11978_1 [Eumeta japonica]
MLEKKIKARSARAGGAAPLKHRRRNCAALCRCRRSPDPAWGAKANVNKTWRRGDVGHLRDMLAHFIPNVFFFRY